MVSDFDVFWNALTWRPIAEFDDAGEDVVLLRAGEEWALGYYGPGWDADQDVTWRVAQESADAAPLAFNPAEFATVGDEWRVHLMAD